MAKTGAAPEALSLVSVLLRLLFVPKRPLPNPHIRTSAFIIERERSLSLRVGSFVSKNDTYQFESERGSMTRQIMAQGLRPLVMDRVGNVYDIAEWKASLTFRSGGQINLIVADNRTREYDLAPGEFRQILENQAWEHPWCWAL